MKKRNKRWRLFADRKVQGGLMVRIGLYWAISQVAFFGTYGVFTFVSNGASPFAGLRPALIVSFLVLPFVMLDMLRFSNRSVGPIVNVEKTLANLHSNGVAAPVKLRPNDFHVELANSTNQLIQKFEERLDGDSEHPNGKTMLELECHV